MCSSFVLQGLLPVLVPLQASALELRSYAPRRDGHDYRLHRSNLLTGDAAVPGHAKVLLHSRLATNSEGDRKVEKGGCPLIEDLVVTG